MCIHKMYMGNTPEKLACGHFIWQSCECGMKRKRNETEWNGHRGVGCIFSYGGKSKWKWRKRKERPADRPRRRGRCRSVWHSWHLKFMRFHIKQKKRKNGERPVQQWPNIKKQAANRKRKSQAPRK